MGGSARVSGRPIRGAGKVRLDTHTDRDVHFSLKEPLFQRLRQEIGEGPELSSELWNATTLLNRLGLYTIECFSRTREEVISRQQQELLELSTSVESASGTKSWLFRRLVRSIAHARKSSCKTCWKPS